MLWGFCFSASCLLRVPGQHAFHAAVACRPVAIFLRAGQSDKEPWNLMADVKQRKKMPVSPGRPKGVPNKNTAMIRDMIVQALDNAGGVDYLSGQAKKNPKAFLALIGRVLPMQVTGDGGGPLRITVSRDDEAL